MNDCHSQAVRASRAMFASENRRNSPPSGDSSSPTFEPLPGKSVPLRSVSTKNCVSNELGVESNGVPGIVGSTLSCAATVCDARRSTISTGEKPASPMRAKILLLSSEGSGTSRSGEAREMLERPVRNWRRGPPAQFETATAPANWMLCVSGAGQWRVLHGAVWRGRTSQRRIRRA